MARPYSPELVIAFVAPSGTSFGSVVDAARSRLGHYGYDVSTIRLSDFLADWCDLSGDDARFLDRRTPKLQTAGDEFRSNTNRPDALAYVAVNEIRELRLRLNSRDPEPPGDRSEVEPGELEAPEAEGQEKVEEADAIDERDKPTELDNTSTEEASEELSNKPVPARAYLVWSLKNEKEVETLRNIYQSRFLLVSVYMPREDRERGLAEKIAESRGDIGHADDYREQAVSITNRDETEGGRFGQNVRDTYPLADLFIDATTKVTLEETTTRAIDMAFGAPFETPTKDEWGMFFAEAAKLRSAELGRQVGAAVTSTEGEIIAVGTNEVPRGKGGQYWPDDYPDDYREFRLSRDTSDFMKRRLVGQILEGLRTGGWLVQERHESSAAELYEALGETRLRDLIEFGRAVHAEMSAIIDAARRGVALTGATMYVTTFPCHHCARHIAAAGIRRVVYIYPYAKSLARDLHSDALQTEMLTSPDAKKVLFEPFLGVAPRQYQNFFTMYRRKSSEGLAHPIDDPDRGPRLIAEEREGVWNVDAYIYRELLAIRQSATWFDEQAPPAPSALSATSSPEQPATGGKETRDDKS
jgi:deoxycytidylate deaminase